MIKIHYETIDSTQKEIWRRIENNEIQNGIIISADIQTDGVGTHGRTWYTTQKENIAFSIGLAPNVPINNLENLTLEIAENILEVFEELYQVKLEIKLPNDIMIAGQKVGGILTETKLQGEIVKYLVIGVGINTNNQEISTSISKEFNISIDNSKVIEEFCKIFEVKMAKRNCHITGKE